MQHFTYDPGNGNHIAMVRLESGTCYHEGTSKEVMYVLEQYRHTGIRLRLYYGDTETGRCWGDENDVMGYIGRSNGSIKVPLLIARKDSTRGGAILDHCIIKIQMGQHVLYEHPEFDNGDYVARGLLVFRDGEETHAAAFRTERQAEKWADFMNGNRNSK